ncbi:MAG TPA: glycine cleavage system protein H [Pirellulales bacterium]|jgi:glycine cleavage system H protein|nr:glycine cleavage system protein H [Pirellulales bacterium]
MSAELVFMMGQFAARFPTDRQYAKNHMWAQQQPSGGYRFGFSAYAVRLLQDVYFLEWTIDEGAKLRERQPIGAIESSKAESELYAPLAGRLTRFNARLLSDPSTINVDTYGNGWLFALDAPGDGLLSPEQYLVHLADAWKVAERTIKGQMNEE